MTDAPAQTPPPRAFRSSSLPDTELEQIGQLTAFLAENPNAYESHARLIKILHKGLLYHVHSEPGLPGENDPRSYDLLQDLQQARNAMSSRFSLGEELWVEMLQDQQLLARTLEDCMGVIELYEKAITDEVASVKLWGMYGELMLLLYDSANPDDSAGRMGTNINQWIKWSEEDQIVAAEVFGKAQMLEVWMRGAEEVKFNLSDSHLVWDRYADLLIQGLGSCPSAEDVAALKSHFIERLQIPHATWDETFQKFSSFISTYDNAAYEEIMVSVNALAAGAKAQFGIREAFELKLLAAVGSGDKTSAWTLFSEYLDWEMSHHRKKKVFSFDLANALFQRAVLQFPSDANLWEDYLTFLSEESDHRQRPSSSLSLLGRACDHCPWSGTLWSRYIQAAERHDLPFADIGQIKHKATSTGLLDLSSMEDVLKIHTAWCSFLRRRAFAENATEEEPDVAEVGILSAIEDTESLGQQKYGKEYQGDPQYRLERIYIKFLDQGQKHDLARERWKKLVSRHGESYEFWLRYYWWEMITWGKVTGDRAYGSNSVPREATKVLQQAARRTKLDWPEKILDTYLIHCEDHENATEIQAATVHWRKATKALGKRREQEAMQAAAYAEQRRREHVAQAQVQNEQTNGSKRKRDSDDVVGASEVTKKSRMNGTDAGDGEQTQSVAPAALKRDRENTTVIVRNLPSDTNEKWVRHFFKDVRGVTDGPISVWDGS